MNEHSIGSRITMFKEVVELIKDIKITEETIFPSFLNSTQLDGAKEVEEIHESKNNAKNKTDEKDSIFPDFFKDIILK